MNDIILSIKSKTSRGIGGTPTSIIRLCVDYISIPLSLLVNQSFELGLLLDELKSALVKQIK